MARAGRPRKQGPRTKSGRLKQQHDAGTDELRAKKVALVGPGGDPSKSTNTIDILESWGHLTKDQSRSLHYFVKVRSLMIGICSAERLDCRINLPSQNTSGTECPTR